MGLFPLTWPLPRPFPLSPPPKNCPRFARLPVIIRVSIEHAKHYIPIFPPLDFRGKSEKREKKEKKIIKNGKESKEMGLLSITWLHPHPFRSLLPPSLPKTFPRFAQIPIIIITESHTNVRHTKKSAKWYSILTNPHPVHCSVEPFLKDKKITIASFCIFEQGKVHPHYIMKIKIFYRWLFF